MKRIFHIISHFDMGGAEKVAVSIAQSANPDMEYHIVEVERGHSEFTKTFIRELEESHIYYHRSLMPDIRFHFIFERLAALCFPLWFIVLFLKYRPTVIHSHTEVPDMSVFAFFRFYPWLQKKCKIVRTIHNNRLWTGQQKLGRHVEQFFQSAHSNVAISPSVQSSYHAVYGSSPYIIYNGVAPVCQRVYPGLVKGKMNILFAGRFEKQKGIDTLLEVILRMRQDERYHFHVIGDGQLREEVSKRLDGIANVTLRQPIFGLSSYLSSFDYMLMPSEFEGLSILSIESGLAKLPNIINDCPGLVDTLPENWPLKVRQNDINRYVSIFQNLLPCADRTALGEKSFAFSSEHFSIQKMQGEYENFYNH